MTKLTAMDWFYLPMVKAHAVLAWCAVGLFIVRGLGHQFNIDAGWVMDERVRTLVFTAHLLLVICGLCLWFALQRDVTVELWMTAKLLALAVYFPFGHWALGRGEFRVVSYLVALLALAYVIAVSMTRQVLLGL